MNEMAEIKDIESKIYNIRGAEVMLDSDLARQYQCANGTKSINLAVKRNKDRFPSDFYFQLNEEEYNQICGFNLKLQNNKIRSLPYVFTEQGVAMLATIIRTDVAATVSIDIMRAFVRMRNYIKYNDQLLPRKYLLLEEKVDNNTKRIDELFDKFNPKVITKNSIFFQNDIYDAYSVLMKIFKLSEGEIIIIDNYAGKELFDILRIIHKKIIIISSHIDETLKKKYLKQYNNVLFIKNDSYHDRFIIIDRKMVFHSGASFKDLGKKCFAINEIENKIENDKLINDVIKNCSIDN
ncbi:MAG: ORF6N domain-containing protein [Bacilli bacterium]|nr:ORF6N domain-containing protein [Mycoplasmatota bacterium]MDD6942110.1 ORF6N domain-containing protein [bacterium]MDY2697726.1 ORF6N domain-containing protein [Bacilli bacterium]MEE0014821.1 ORF6N domain-containing protein [Bacilli bacterium]